MNYQVNIAPVKSHEAVVLKFLLKFLGHDQKDKMEILIQHGGTVVQNLNKQTATSVANQLRKLGVLVDVTTMISKEPNELFLVRLLSAGKYEVNVIKVIHDLTKLSLKEAKEIVDRLGVVAENLNKKEAESIRKMLEAVGAKVRIKEMSSSEPQIDDEPQPDIDDCNTIYGNLTDKNGQSLAKFNITINDSTIEKWLSLVDAFKEKEK